MVKKRGSNLLIIELGYRLLPSHDMTEIMLKQHLSSKQLNPNFADF